MYVGYDIIKKEMHTPGIECESFDMGIHNQYHDKAAHSIQVCDSFCGV